MNARNKYEQRMKVPERAMRSTDKKDLRNKSPTSSILERGCFGSSSQASDTNLKGSRGTSNELCCNYDGNVSMIYSLLESSSWETAVTRCRTFPIEIRTWVVKYEKKSTEIRWKLLPIHAAIIFRAPVFVVRTFIETYPESVMLRDVQMMLPLHLGFRHNPKDEEVLELLLNECPKAICEPDIRGRTPHMLCRDGTFSAKFLQIYSESWSLASSSKKTPQSYNRDKHLENEVRNQLEENRVNYIKQIDISQSQYSERVTILNDNHEKEIRKLREDARLEKEELAKTHEKEMKALKNKSTSPPRLLQKDETILADRIIDLESELELKQTETQTLQSVIDGMREYSKMISSQMRKASQDQNKLQRLIMHQQGELEGAREMRAQLLKTLLQQEVEDGPNLTSIRIEIEETMRAVKLRLDAFGESEVQSVSENKSDDLGSKLEQYVQVKSEEDDNVSAITEDV
mmetsp:Transcript_40284/g.45841  ORF Transcript_40284/g.45841 Transcript_40284/m.45841 type:complete len:459 (-) Transcript_40284:402-1778(-)